MEAQEFARVQKVSDKARIQTQPRACAPLKPALVPTALYGFHAKPFLATSSGRLGTLRSGPSPRRRPGCPHVLGDVSAVPSTHKLLLLLGVLPVCEDSAKPSFSGGLSSATDFKFSLQPSHKPLGDGGCFLLILCVCAPHRLLKNKTGLSGKPLPSLPPEKMLFSRTTCQFKMPTLSLTWTSLFNYEQITNRRLYLPLGCFCLLSLSRTYGTCFSFTCAIEFSIHPNPPNPAFLSKHRGPWGQAG